MKNKIILLGLFKCGLTSFTAAFRAAGMRVAYWVNDRGDFYADLVLKAFIEGKDLLHFIQEYDAYTHIDLITWDRCILPHVNCAEALADQYPDAKFILNYRDIEHHIRSIQNWGDLAGRLAHHGYTDLRSFIERHHDRIREHYQSMPNFIDFNIERDHSEKLSEFLGMEIHLPHENKTTENV